RPEIKTDPILVKAISRGFTWFERLTTANGDSIESIARRERVTGRYVRRMIQLAFLSPDIVESVLNGRKAARISTRRLAHDDMPLVWQQQSVAIFGAG